MRLNRPIQTRFRFGSPSLVNLATYRNSQAHSSKGTPSWPPKGDDTLTVCKPTVSGTISLPSRGAFHLSLTVLYAIGRQEVFCLGGWSPLLPTGFHVSRGTLDHGQLALPFAYRTFTFCGGSFQILRLGLARIMPVRNPGRVASSGLGSSPFARRY